MKPRHVERKPWRHGSGNEPRLVKGKGSRAEANMCVINSRQPSAQQSGAVRCGYPGYAVIAAVGRQCVGWVRWWAWLHRPEQKVACVWPHGGPVYLESPEREKELERSEQGSGS